MRKTNGKAGAPDASLGLRFEEMMTVAHLKKLQQAEQVLEFLS